MNAVSYYKLSDWDCYTLSLNTHKQIEKMSKECKIAQGQMFLFWNRFYTHSSYEQQSTYFGVTTSTLHRWFQQTKAALLKWSNGYLINGKTKPEDQYWTIQRIHANTPEFIRRLHDPQNKGFSIVAMDGTYIPTQQNQKNWEIRRLMWSQHKKYTLIKPHIVCTLSGL